MSLKKLIDVSTLSQLLKGGIVNSGGVRLLDCTYSIGPKPDWRAFKHELYGKFQAILSQPSVSKQLYLSGHIPEAVHMSLDAAMFPSKYERFALYPSEIFEEYMQSYGHEKLSVLDGGFDRWVKTGHETSTEDVKLMPGDWEAKDDIGIYNINFEELESKDGEKMYIERTDEVNFLDSRIRGQFNGTEDTGLDPYRVGGSNIPGFKNTPAAELLDENGVLKSTAEIKEWLATNGYKHGQPIVTNCNTGMQAAMLAFAIDLVYPDVSLRVYNGSLKEMELRDPKRISSGGVHLKH
ncbi:unnamed protein product [Nippostrongylus brasiliensis]|uniref:Putative thiosulfate sulfurtransferase (inferred by orthology to a C. elegans protein) n=1 Tax=Nippostrongylus brasiliensis TaxID=27835 RepID=A0A0N4YTU8_NIPBR|nr:unnamed protein product [Nippostrongylus brasiliensis]